MEKTLKEAQIRRMVDLLKNYGEEYSTHPDPVARLYSALQDLTKAVGKRMETMRAEK